MEFNNEEKGLLVSGLLALQDVADKSKSSDSEKQKIGSEIMSLINKINGSNEKDKLVLRVHYRLQSVCIHNIGMGA